MSLTANLEITRLPYSNNHRMARIVERGIRARAVKPFAQVIGLSLPAIAEFMSISPRTLQRRIADDAVLRRVETERLVRLGRLFVKALDVFDDVDAAARWLREPIEALDGRSPLRVGRVEPGTREVEQVLGRIEHGVL